MGAPRTESESIKQLRARLFTWHFRHFSGASGDHRSSENKYAQWLANKIDQPQSASTIKKWKAGGARPVRPPDLRRLAAALSADANPNGAAHLHCLWELTRAFAQDPGLGQYSAAHADKNRCDLQPDPALSGAPETGDAQPLAPTLDSLQELVAERLHDCPDRLWLLLAQKVFLPSAMMGVRDRAFSETEQVVETFTRHDHGQDPLDPVAVNRLLSLMPRMTLPPPHEERRRSVAALMGLFQLSLMRFAVRQLPADLQTQDGVAQLAERNLVALALLHEAHHQGLLHFEASEGAASAAKQARPSHYVSLSPVTVPGQSAAHAMVELAGHMDHATDISLGVEHLAGRLRSTANTARADGVFWRAVLDGDDATRNDRVLLARQLFESLSLPCIVPREAQTPQPHLRETAQFLEQKVLEFLKRLQDLLNRSPSQ